MSIHEKIKLHLSYPKNWDEAFFICYDTVKGLPNLKHIKEPNYIIRFSWWGENSGCNSFKIQDNYYEFDKWDKKTQELCQMAYNIFLDIKEKQKEEFNIKRKTFQENEKKKLENLLKI